MTLAVRAASVLARFHYLFLAPIIILGIPSAALFNQDLLALVAVLATGLAGTLLRRRQLVVLASGSLLGLLVFGKVAVDLLKSNPPDTAVFLVEFGMVVYFLEACLVLLTYNRSLRELESKEDELSRALEGRLALWFRSQVSRQSMIGLGSLGLSVILLPVAGLTSISSGELPLTAALLLIAVVALFFLVTYRRGPGEQ